MIPVKKATLKTINRFPQLYKMQAMQVIDSEVHDAINTTADCFVMASILALVEEFNFGTTERSTRILKFTKRLQSIIDTNSEFFDDAVREGLKNKLHNLGIEYQLRGDTNE